VVAAAAAGLLALSGCANHAPSSSASGSSSGSAADAEPIKIGLIVSKTGNFAPQALDEINGVMAALDHLTKGTMKVNGHKLEVTTGDDTGVPAVGTGVAKQMIADGAKIIIGPTSSAVAVPVAQLCVQNDVLYLGGTSGTTDLVGMSDLVFATSGASPAGSQLTKAMLGGDDLQGKVLATVDQDYAYGQSVQQGLKALLEPLGVKVQGYLLPQNTTDFSAVALQIKQLKPDFLTSSWAGAGQNQLWSTFGSQGLTKLSTTFSSLLLRNSWAAIADSLGAGLTDAVFTLGYFPGMTNNAEDKALQAYAKAHDHTIEYDDVVGWNGGAMIVRAVDKGGSDPAKMATALQDWSFEGPSGDVTIRAKDNQVTVPSATVHLSKDSSGQYQPKLIKIYSAKDLTPPVVAAIK
jgi:branched-chain amino acid transport system substrate-binding protein